MRNFLIFCLALALVFFQVVANSYVPRGLTVPIDVKIGKSAQISEKLTDTNAVEAWGIPMEVVVQAPTLLVLPIPTDKPTPDFSNSWFLNVNLTNNTPNPICPSYDTLLPELIAPDGQILQRQSVTNRGVGTGEYTRNLVNPGQRFGFFAQVALVWENNKLQLKIVSSPWYFEDIKPGAYQLRFVYENSGEATSCSYRGEETRVERTGIGRGGTNFLSLRIVEPVLIDGNVAQLDGMRFELIVPQRLLIIPPNQPDAYTPVQLGLRITNNSSVPRRFNQLDSLIPGMVSSLGYLLQVEGARNRTRQPQISDCPLIQPGKSLTLSVDAKIFWHNRKLRLGGNDRFNGTWYFDSLNPSLYRIGFGYPIMNPTSLSVYDPEIRASRLLTDICTVPVVTPMVDIRLVAR
ncbi:exported hypothetical protein [Planktothrix serta PCC 8927]|uniref:CARDB domain-containing protein n=1 Tax=Planktothrix serta PCC 8927 TaxID=671068 RepID=A0A7Z9E5H1_9CYAN|nr:hypothetical protein [Planktothrix serta]VXD25186.1 exported hypothetical protein [Planktothrix serta PCC 8927]